MLKRQTWMLIMLLIALVAFTGCSDDDDDPVTPPADTFATVATAVTEVLNNGSTPSVILASDLWADISSKAPTMTVVDVRTGETDGVSHYDLGHIPGAIHSSLGTLVSDLNDGTIPTDLDWLVFVCYTGQSAGHAKIAAELLGYPSQSLKFGMSAWNGDVAGTQWSEAEKCKDLLLNPETEGNNGDLVEHDYPSMTDNLETRVAATLANGFKAKGYDPEEINSDDYFILNYWGETDYLGDPNGSGTTGHIPGAFQFTPAQSLDMDEMLNNLPTEMPIIVYCWTGQTSSQVTFALNAMGYEAYSLAYGANQLMWSSLNKSKWTDAAQGDYDLEVTPVPAN